MTNRGVVSISGSTLGRGGRRPQAGDPLGSNDIANRRYADQVGIGAPFYAATLKLKNKFSLDRGLYNFKGANTRRVDQGRSDAMVGGMTRHLVIGDSVSDGYTSGVGVVTIDHAHAWPLMMRDQMAVTGIPANGTGFVKTADNTALDSRWVYTGTWSNQVSYAFCSTITSTTTYTAERPGTILDIWYINASGTFTVSIDGAASGTNFATISTNVGTTWSKYRMYGVTVNIGSTIKITLTVAGTGIGISGVSIWSPNAGLIVDNLGMGGAHASGTGSAVFGDFAAGPLAVQRYVAGKVNTITDAATTSGVATITSASSSFAATGDTLLGEAIDQFPDATGALFPPNTYITGRTSATVLTTSNTALVTATGKTLRLGRDPHCVHIALGGNDIQTSGAGGANTEAPATAIKAIAALYPNSDIILHLENQGSPTLYAGADYLRWQQRMYTLADELDVPLYDWYDRAGSYSTAFNNGVFQDYQAHMIPGIYADLGSSLAQALGGGSGQPQYWGTPSYLGDLVNKRYVDAGTGVTLGLPAPRVANLALTLATEVIVQQWTIPANTLAVGTTLRLEAIGICGSSSTILARLRVGTAGTTSDVALVATTASPAGVGGAGFRAGATVTCRTLGATGTIIGEVFADVDSVAIRRTTSGVTVNVATTGQLILSLTLTSATTASTAYLSYGELIHQ